MKNKNTAKISALVLLLCLAITMLSACGGFNLTGTWRVTSGVWGQATPGAVINFTNSGTCNLYSPQDTYVYSNGTLSGTGLLGGNYSFQVKVTDNSHIDLIDSNVDIAMIRG